MSEGERRLMSGSEAIVQGALQAGCRAYFGYPITPSSEIMEGMAEALPRLGGAFVQMEDEMGSMAALVGASWAGAKPMTATSGPGFSLMQENIGLATVLELPCVVVNVQRVGPSTGMPTLGSQQDTLQALWGRHGDQTIIVLAPSCLQEMYDLTARAFNLAERYRVPVVLLTDGHMARLRGEVVPSEDLPVAQRPRLQEEEYRTPYRAGPDEAPGFAPLGSGAEVLATGLMHDERGFPTQDLEESEALVRRLRDKVVARQKEIVDYEAAGLDDADVILVGYGVAGPSVRWARDELRRRGIAAGSFVPRTLSPFPTEELGEVLRSGAEVLVAELGLGQLGHLVREAAGRERPLGAVQRLGSPIDPRRLVDAALGQVTGVGLR